MEANRASKEEEEEIEREETALAWDDSIELEEREGKRQSLAERQEVIDDVEALNRPRPTAAWDTPISITYNWTRREMTVKFDVIVENFEEREFY